MNDIQGKDSSYYDKLRRNEWKGAASIGPSSLSRYRVILKILKEYDFHDPLLDCGCGSGTLLSLIKSLNKFSTIVGSDFSQEAVNQSQRKGHTVFKGDLTAIDNFEGKKFNTIICSEVLEHIEKDSLAVNNLHSILENNGKLLITVPYSMKYWSIHDEFSGHVRRYNLDELEAKLENAGFRIIESFIWGGLFYSIYHRFLVKTKPNKVMSSKSKGFPMIVLGKMLYYTFILDDLFPSKKRGRRIFLIAQKKDPSL